jgi:hypothetical protein
MTGEEGLGLAAFCGVRVRAGEDGGRDWKAGAGEPGVVVEGPNASSRPKRSCAAEEGWGCCNGGGAAAGVGICWRRLGGMRLKGREAGRSFPASF